MKSTVNGTIPPGTSLPADICGNEWSVTTKPWPPPFSYDGKQLWMRTDPDIYRRLSSLQVSNAVIENDLVNVRWMCAYEIGLLIGVLVLVVIKK